jgi:hypothetical protein
MLGRFLPLGTWMVRPFSSEAYCFPMKIVPSYYGFLSSEEGIDYVI